MLQLFQAIRLSAQIWRPWSGCRLTLPIGQNFLGALTASPPNSQNVATGTFAVGARICRGLALCAALAFCLNNFAAPASGRPETVAETTPTNQSVTLSIRTAAGKKVPFTPADSPQLEMVNGQLNLAVSSREGMIFELTSIPAKDGIAARRYRGSEFRALLLHTGFQEPAATDDEFKKASKLEIRRRDSKARDGEVEFKFRGKLRAGAEILDVRFHYSGLLPAERKSVIPNQSASIPETN